MEEKSIKSILKKSLKITNLNVFNNQMVGIESLILSIALGILQKVEEELS